MDYPDGPNIKDCQVKKPSDYWTCFTFAIYPLVSYYTAREVLQMQSRKLTSRGGSNTTAETHRSHGLPRWWYYSGSVTPAQRSHWSKWFPSEVQYKDKDLTMEKALRIIRIYAAKPKAKGMTVNYLKGKGMGPGYGKAQPNYNNEKQASQRGKPWNQDSKDKCGKCRKGIHQQGQRCPTADQEWVSILQEKGILWGGMLKKG